MNATSILLVLGVFVVAATVVQAFYWFQRAREDDRAREIARRIGTADEEDEDSPLLRLQAAKARRNEGSEVDRLLLMAGSPYPVTVLYAWMGGAAILGLIVGMVALRGPAGLIGMVVGLIPLLVLRSQAQSRNNRLSEQLPDALDLLSRSLQAGHGIAEAMKLVSEEIPDPIGREFGRVYEENNLGRDFRECYLNLTRRNPGNFDLQIFSGAVLLQRDTGGNLVEILGSISNTIRQRFLFHGKVAALTSEARFTGYILAALPVCIGTFLAIARPDYLGILFEDPKGKYLLGYCFSSYCLGGFIMKEISSVET